MCSATCGGGNQMRYRSVAVQSSCGGESCFGVLNESKSCNSQCCAINCAWGSWNNYGPCSETCGGGFKNRNRSIAIVPVCGGLECQGMSTENTACDLNPCPVGCQWSKWSDWETCSQSCGGGTQTRKRNILVASLYGGKECIPKVEDIR